MNLNVGFTENAESFAAGLNKNKKDFDAKYSGVKLIHGKDGEDGISPIVTVESIFGGHRVTITDASGTQVFDVMNGEDGSPGATGSPGAAGSPGKDGYSPSVTVVPITGGNRVTITDTNGIKTFDVMDGSDGKDGLPGTPGKDGKDGVSVSHKWNGTVLEVTSASGTSSADLRGKQGIQGERGIPGTPGKDGHTPEKGVDYWTEDDKAELIQQTAEKINIPTKLSELENDKGYLTKHQDISGKVNKSGDTMTGTLIANYSSDGKQVRNVHLLSSTLDQNIGENGDIAIVVRGSNMSSVTLTNMLTTSDMKSGWTIAGSESPIGYGGGYSIKLDGIPTKAETTVATNDNWTLNNTHIYYGRWYCYQITKNTSHSTECFFPVATPTFITSLMLKSTGSWQMYSGRNHRSSFANGDYPLRIDFNNAFTEGTMYVSAPMLIDLTAAFDAGNEPSKEWMDEHIPYFTGTMVVEPDLGVFAKIDGVWKKATH